MTIKKKEKQTFFFIVFTISLLVLLISCNFFNRSIPDYLDRYTKNGAIFNDDVKTRYPFISKKDNVSRIIPPIDGGIKAQITLILNNPLNEQQNIWIECNDDYLEKVGFSDTWDAINLGGKIFNIKFDNNNNLLLTIENAKIGDIFNLRVGTKNSINTTGDYNFYKIPRLKCNAVPATPDINSANPIGGSEVGGTNHTLVALWKSLIGTYNYDNITSIQVNYKEMISRKTKDVTYSPDGANWKPNNTLCRPFLKTAAAAPLPNDFTQKPRYQQFKITFYNEDGQSSTNQTLDFDASFPSIIYVRGDMGNDGSPEFGFDSTDPIRTFTKALEIFEANKDIEDPKIVLLSDYDESDSLPIMLNASLLNINNSNFTGKKLTIDGAGNSIIGKGPTGGGVKGIINIVFDNEAPTITFKNLTITGGNKDNSTNGKGGGIYCEGKGSSLIIDNCFITNNYSYGNGGGITIEGIDSNLYVQNGTQISKNEARQNGGGIAVLTGATATLDNCIIGGANTSEGNSDTSNSGGAIYVTSTFSGFPATVYIRNNTKITFNTAAGDGGGIALLNEATATLSDCIIDHNTASGDGGGV